MRDCEHVRVPANVCGCVCAVARARMCARVLGRMDGWLIACEHHPPNIQACIPTRQPSESYLIHQITRQVTSPNHLTSLPDQVTSHQVTSPSRLSKLPVECLLSTTSLLTGYVLKVGFDRTHLEPSACFASPCCKRAFAGYP
eukprot:4358075-Pleurochrysis_carterae.AAC.1